ncbi:hypothetical protein MVEN_00529200 [Mycena venus]|uniref:DUF2786 domain-containing protein n=1 Tax=Mycena venus TaxID=2733690 RepID=A0A8H6YMR2_9AGAR|nr:hypothetical protein MVEN_00529200 [Mycena venus]
MAVGKIMYQFSNERFLNFHGQEAARLTRYQSIYDKPSGQDSSWLMSILSPILFCVPEVHLQSFGKIWVDEIAAKEPWVKFIGKLTSEWSEHTAFATILLNANVAFLGVPGVDPGGSSQSLTQVFSSISLVLSVGSAIIGLILVRQHRTKRIGTADEAVGFFENHKNLKTTAIIYSLPYALLMYGMAFFLLAFMLSCFVRTSMTTRVMLGIFWALASMLVVWCLIWQAYEDSTTFLPPWFDRMKSKWQTELRQSLIMGKRHRHGSEYESSDFSESDSDSDEYTGPSKASGKSPTGKKKTRKANPKVKAPSTKAEVTIRATDTPLDKADSKKRLEKIDSAVIGRIKKALALASHAQTGEDEARAALRMASKLLERHK